MRHLSIPYFVAEHNQSRAALQPAIPIIRARISQLSSETPEVSVVIPAYNEADNILKTLSSLAASTTTKRIEIIVVDNNSGDDTADLVKACGAVCVEERQQGIVFARNAGLAVARGLYILNADADTVYPPDWIDCLINPLYSSDIALTYGLFSFLPSAGTARPVYFAYETIADCSRWLNKRFKEEAMNVGGASSAFRKAEGLLVDSFNHPPGANEDGWLGLKLRDTFQKKLQRVSNAGSIVWTTDRRLQLDGGLVKAGWRRFGRRLGFVR